MNIIIFSHHLSVWAGSETVCLELTEEFQSRGHDVRLICPFASPQFVHSATGDWTLLLKNLAQYEEASVDLVLVLHQGLSRLSEKDFEVLFAMPARPFIAYFHLSPYEPFELPGPFVERALADVVYANSEETKQELGLYGYSDVELFQNPAPAKFETNQPSTGDLKTLLSVSNHVPVELSEALEILQADGIDVRRIGRPEGNRRVTPEDLLGCDALVTIGKTVQFGFRSQRPVFCYDHFQGPGWLAPWTQREENQNFSGRSEQSRLTPEQIADTIKQGFPDARRWACENNTAALSRFKLEVFVDQLLNRASSVGGNRIWPEWTKLPEWRHDFQTERLMHQNVDRYYARANKMMPSPLTITTVSSNQYESKLTRHILRAPRKGEPMVIAIFSFRYDIGLVSGLIENISPSIHGYVSLDDRDALEVLTNEADRQLALYRAAEEMGANWIFVVDPDERYEDTLVEIMQFLTTEEGPVVWTMNCREMFNDTQYRYDGIWSNRARQRLFPCHPGMEPGTDRLHANWTRNAHKLPVKASGIDFYHLRMATPERRALRRRLYAASDPARVFQNIGYDYLDDERGMQLRTVPTGRKFTPAHVEDGDIWVPSDTQIGTTDTLRDPLPHTLRRITRMREMQGYESAMHAIQDLVVEHPEDCELALLAADTALRAGCPDVAVENCLRLVSKQSEPLFALRMLADAYINLGDISKARNTITKLDELCPKFNSSLDLKTRLQQHGEPDAFNAPDALWRRWLTEGKKGTVGDVYSGSNIPDAQIVVVVIGIGGEKKLAAAVTALRAQPIPCEIVVVNSNGGSARETLQEHLDFIRIISIEERLYAGAARNVGIDASKAKFVAFLASDCVPLDGWLEDCLNAHLDGYSAVPSIIEPQKNVSNVSLANWIWLYSYRLGATSMIEESAYSFSYSRRLFDQYGYFPSGARIGEDTILNNRFRNKIEVAQGLGISLLHTFESEPQAVEKDIRTRARRRTLWVSQVNDLTTDSLRDIAKSQAESRLESARKALFNAQLLDHQNPALIKEKCEKFAKLEEQQTVETGLVILKAKMLKERADSVLLSEPDVACAYMDEANELWPNSAEMLFFSAKCALCSPLPERQGAAVDLAIRAFSIDPDTPDAILLAIQVLVADKQFQRAYDVFRWAVTLNPTSIRLLMSVSHLPGPGFRSIRGMYFQMAFVLSPWAPQPNRQLINYYKQIGDHSASDCRKAIFETFE